MEPLLILSMFIFVASTIVVAIVLYQNKQLTTVKEYYRHMAFYDDLTGLANRALLMDRLDHLTKQRMTKQRNTPFTVLFIDINDFKQINDTQGHDKGDSILQLTAGELSANVREGDTVARLAGDEFIIVLPNLSDIELRQIKRRIRTSLESIGVFISIGRANYPECDTIEKLLKTSDKRMYNNKRKYKKLQKQFHNAKGVDYYAI